MRTLQGEVQVERLVRFVKFLRRVPEYREWQCAVKKRANGICQACGEKGKRRHHKTGFTEIVRSNGIESYQEAKQCEALWDVDNGILLCKKCHREEEDRRNHVHKKLAQKNHPTIQIQAQDS